MRVLLTTIGTAGDVHPYVAIALALKARGHEVTLLANPYFKERILAAGIGFWPLGTTDGYLRLVKSTKLVTQRESVDFVFNELILGTFMPQVEALREAVRVIRPDVVVNHHICFGVGAACEAMGVCHVQGVLAPLFWLSREERIALPTLPIPDAPWLVHKVLRGLMRVVGRIQFDRPINRLRREVGAPAIRHAFAKLARGGDGLVPGERLERASQGVRTLGLWSEHFRPPRADDPITGTICGFCTWDRPPATDAQREQEQRVLRWMDQDAPPVLVTLGSSVSHHGADVYEVATRACEAIGARAVLLVGGDEGAEPSTQNARVLRVPYVSYGPAMLRAAAIVHHAGVGTAAAAMRSGAPSVIIPFANDEFDNSVRARRLGVAEEICVKRLSVKMLASALERALNDQDMRAKAAALGEQMRQENGAERAAGEIEAFVRGRAM